LFEDGRFAEAKLTSDLVAVRAKASVTDQSMNVACMLHAWKVTWRLSCAPMPNDVLTPAPTLDAGAAAEASSRVRYRGLIWLVSAAFFMQALDSTIVNTAVPAMAEALGVTPLGMRSALTSYVLTLAILIPASPWLCDRFGTRRVFGAAIAVFGLGSLFCGISQTLPQLGAAGSGCLIAAVGRAQPADAWLIGLAGSPGSRRCARSFSLSPHWPAASRPRPLRQTPAPISTSPAIRSAPSR
jgi:hypothetical protein